MPVAVKKEQYEIVVRMGHLGIKCLTCGMVSYSYMDRKKKYCGNCNKFHEDK